MFDDEIGFAILLIGFFGWVLFFVAVGDSDVTELPNGCILYEDKIYCEEVSE